MTARERLLACLRIPPPPAAPRGDEHVRVFRAAPNYFRYRVLIWLVRQLGAGLGLVFGVLMVTGNIGANVPAEVTFGALTVPRRAILALIAAGEAAAIAGYIAQLIASGALLRLDFEQRWYMVSDRSLRIREGLMKVHEKTMTFANIQHVAIRQDPVQRWLGIADLEVRTAGGGGSAAQDQHAKVDLHVGYFRGLANAPEIRDIIRTRLKRYGDAGLGDPDDLHHAIAEEPGWPADARPGPGAGAPSGSPAGNLAAAAARLRDEARALRLALES